MWAAAIARANTKVSRTGTGQNTLSSCSGTTERATLARRKSTKSSGEPVPVPGAPADGAGASARVRELAATAEAANEPAAEPQVPARDEPVHDRDEAPPAAPKAITYTVVARRYRPQRLEDVVGQEHVVRSLRNAIRLNRIAQAYLFCGTRGVGKTSMARIFAKCLNCVKGPTEEPCQICDICQSIAEGQDVDVIEIDGASNNGVEQVRELRQNAALRPSRARYKIYYIDEVHMLSTGAFNALLKTLEEPPPHVKFLFATTEPNKIPITVLSRCQRYDFAGIIPELIARTLAEICAREQVEAEPEALQAVARRVGGSLRDAQSLLDRLLASGSERLTVEVVHSLLGIASDERLLAMLDALAKHDSCAALRLLDESSLAGVQPADFVNGLIDFVRDALVLAAGAESVLLAVSPRHRADLKNIIERWPLDSILAALQILSECRSRMRGSSHSRLLVELAIVRVARLEDMVALAALVERLTALESGPMPVRKPESGETARQPVLPEALRPTPEPTPQRGVLRPPPTSAPPSIAPKQQPAAQAVVGADGSVSIVDEPRAKEQPAKPISPSIKTGSEAQRTASIPTAESHSVRPETAAPIPYNLEPPATADALPDDLPPLDIDRIREVWPELVKKVGVQLGWRLSQIELNAGPAADVLVMSAKAGYNSAFDECGTPEALAKIGQTLERLIHRPVKITYERSSDGEKAALDSRQSSSRRAESVQSDPLVQRVVELFEARQLQLDYDEEQPAAAE
jgi:DNA polymerase-3 subunit gamma/tau